METAERQRSCETQLRESQHHIEAVLLKRIEGLEAELIQESAARANANRVTTI
jgi:hypothetical protein